MYSARIGRASNLKQRFNSSVVEQWAEKPEIARSIPLEVRFLLLEIVRFHFRKTPDASVVDLFCLICEKEWNVFEIRKSTYCRGSPLHR